MGTSAAGTNALVFLHDDVLGEMQDTVTRHPALYPTPWLLFSMKEEHWRSTQLKLIVTPFELDGNWYGTFRADFHHSDRIELDLRGNTHVRGADLSCPRLKWADMVLI